MKTNTRTHAMKRIVRTIIMLATIIYVPLASAGVFDPDCTAEKAAKSAAAKATVSVGGRCSPAEAAKDTAKRVTGIDGKGSVVTKRADLAKGTVKKVVK